ncbi:MAG: hypothetical protein Q8T08_26235, partial [Ignavibacteria bacterium]|nr:hypothetical protein [Ignavibacteria bacterium]
MDICDYIQSERSELNFFSLTKFYMEIKFKIRETNGHDETSRDNFSILLHEYTHYLQGLCTTLGSVTMFKYFSLQHKIIEETTKKILAHEDYGIDLFSKYKNEYDQINAIYNYDFRQQFPELPKYSILMRQIEHPVIKGFNREFFIKLDTDYCQHVSPKCLRETMAMMSILNLKRLSKDDAKLYLENKDFKPIYKYLYIYLYDKYPKIHDLVKFTYYFSELCLQSEKPANIFENLIVFIDKTIESYSNADNFFNN